ASDYVMGRRATGGYRFGAGYVNAELDELHSISMTGTFSAVDAGGSGGGLYHGAFMAPDGGNMVLMAGSPNGFSDGSGQHLEDANNGVADTLTFVHTATVANRINAVQFLYDALIYDTSIFTLSSVLKAGIGQNEILGNVVQTYADEDSMYGKTFSDKDHTLAIMGSVGVTGRLYLFSWLAVVGGYDLTVINGVALSPEQQVVGGTYRVNGDGHLIYHAARVGAEITY
ncbi:MAG: hypothetical protein KDA89_17920, partial [Planctomycetaceae bacterium]|nr:hypothetical protein [Planctomycetaceae bacterium]